MKILCITIVIISLLNLIYTILEIKKIVDIEKRIEKNEKTNKYILNLILEDGEK